MYCVYLTIYTGNKLPPFYIGSTSLKKINKGYNDLCKFIVIKLSYFKNIRIKVIIITNLKIPINYKNKLYRNTKIQFFEIDFYPKKYQQTK